MTTRNKIHSLAVAVTHLMSFHHLGDLSPLILDHLLYTPTHVQQRWRTKFQSCLQDIHDAANRYNNYIDTDITFDYDKDEHWMFIHPDVQLEAANCHRCGGYILSFSDYIPADILCDCLEEEIIWNNLPPPLPLPGMNS